MTSIFTIVPFFSSQMLPGTIRTGIALSFTLIIYPVVAPTLPDPALPILQMVGLLFKEAVIGILFGYFFSIPFRVAEGVGFFIDNQRGTGMASVFNPLAGGESSLTLGWQYTADPGARLSGTCNDAVEDGHLMISCDVDVQTPGRYHLPPTRCLQLVPDQFMRQYCAEDQVLEPKADRSARS